MKRAYPLTPPEVLEKRLLSIYPNLDANIENLLTAREELHWPDWCWLPMAASYAVVTGGADAPFAQRFMANAGLDNYRALSAIVPWRLNKTIYRFDPDLARELMDKDALPGDIPVSVLYRMPYPCVYIENPPGIEDAFDGLFCFLEWDHRYPNATELRMHYLSKSGAVVGLYIQWTGNRELLFAKMQANNEKLLKETGRIPASDITDEEYAMCINRLYSHLNLLLYLCSDEPDVTRANPIPRRRGRGTIQTANYPDRIDAGAYIGAAIRKHQDITRSGGNLPPPSYLSASSPVRPHMRRAHWHLYWTGPGRKVPRVKWLSPIFVNADGHSIPTTIHPVK